MTKNKCAWTNKWSSGTIPIDISARFGKNKPIQHMQFNVLPEHETNLRTYISNIFKFGPGTTVAILVGTLCLPLFSILGLRQWDGLVFLSLGLMLVLWPYTTTQATVQTIGARNTIRMTRAVAIGICIFGTYRLWALI